ncbi:LTA synthase family protein [Bacillus sp. PS06]|uniref:LTA synthase family protein n=1 Tax=Bacillus sp. PS06 TaxID=2764176 RepID=UPI00177C648D|nr:LTA synthase family protein [Bacillus sp. PS06]MBD8071350.1 LTA synthase family protein [Bacillus sp. PS06]
MNKSSFPKLQFLLLATVFMWIKTYIVYKTRFDIKIESWMQEFILFINPLSFLLLVFGISLFMKEKRRSGYIIIVSFLSSAILFANVVFYRFFNDFITIPVLLQTKNMADLGSSFTELFKFSDLLLFADVLILVALYFFKPNLARIESVSRKERRYYYLMVAALFFFNLGLSETERPQLLTRTFDREILIKNIGTYNYHIYDIVLQSKSSAQRALADSSNFVDIENYFNANYKKPDEEMFNIANGKNIILVSLESTQSFVINETVNGEEITPFLNDLIEDSYYYENFYHQTAQGKTSDSEFILDNSLYPLGRGAVFFTHGSNEFTATPEIIKEFGYYSSVLHANNKSFWNRDIMYESLGYDKFFDIESYEVNEENSVGWGLKDKEFFEQSVDLMKTQPQPFYSKLITLTNHFPFELGEEDKQIDELDTRSKTLNRYIPTVRYQDEAVKHFIQKLKDEGLYENSILIFYGDHYGISENHNVAMGEFLGKEITPFDSVQLQRVPLIIHIPGVTDGENSKLISDVAGQIDLKPTILHMLGINTKNDIHFGTDLFSGQKVSFTVLRDGSFITDDYVYTKSTCYDKETGEEIEESNCEPYFDKASRELEYSDQIIYGDLLRFYEGTTYNEELENAIK